jgi:hypothetical protein
MQHFHPEDACFMTAGDHFAYSFTNQVATENQGLQTFGLAILLEKSQFEDAIGEMQTQF